jgi:large subunit ribosomal protein L28
MSKVCSVCGKKPGFGHNRSHSMVATNRRFDPNLQRVRMFVDGVARRAYVCTRCLKGSKTGSNLVQKAVGGKTRPAS